MAFSTRPSPPLAAPRRPFLVRWWYDPVQRRRAIIAAVLALLFGSGLAYGSWTRVCAAERCPSITRIDPSTGHNVQVQTSKVYAADGRLITELGIQRRTVLPLQQIPVFVRQAFIAVEDKRFYAHHGIDYWRILGALKANITTLHYTQGFSTITMQLARNVFPEQLGHEKKLARKLREARVAVELERNQIDLGPNVAGVEAAAQVYFGKSARDLNVAEAATLAALPKAPGTYNPRNHPDNAIRRRNAWSGCGRRSSSRASGAICTTRACASIRRSTSTCRKLPSSRCSPSSTRSSRGCTRTGSSKARRIANTSSRDTRRRRNRARSRRTCRVRCSRSTPRPATSWRWWGAATSATRSGIA